VRPNIITNDDGFMRTPIALKGHEKAHASDLLPIFLKRGEWVHDKSKDAERIETVFVSLVTR